ncbi:CreA family protein [Hyphomicrobium sulfonivorans]|uniref:CreA family protein n=1 Tax=Hyphomicrobium sulfonivorans TaxID=121290 RepID=UPI00156E2EF0|nr:CreA family protein [Hyphomicrobium sulfonivorans]MBI1648937.1 CreA family protein [Hyphomicrobium sulfonivorans]NSL70528.1 hypothetical protein [Hyphomicrobium sulfonivorans]
MRALALCLGLVTLSAVAALAKDPDLIFKKTTVWQFFSPDHKLATYAIDDPDVEGVTCYFTVPEKGGWSGWLGLAEELPKASLACQQVGPIKFAGKLKQGDEAFSQRRSLIFKRMQIVRGCDAKRNVLVYLAYTDRPIEGSPESATAAVPISPWGATEPVKCSDWIKE